MIPMFFQPLSFTRSVPLFVRREREIVVEVYPPAYPEGYPQRLTAKPKRKKGTQE